MTAKQTRQCQWCGGPLHRDESPARRCGACEHRAELERAAPRAAPRAADEEPRDEETI